MAVKAAEKNARSGTKSPNKNPTASKDQNSS
jgi:hypothetical protein